MTPLHALHRPAGTLSVGDDSVVLTPDEAGWEHCGLWVQRLAAGETRAFSTGSAEYAVLPLAGALTVEVDGRRFDLAGRDSVFSAVTDWAYLPIDAEVRLGSVGGCEVALPSALANRRFEPVHVAAGDVAVEVRGAGAASRQVTNFCAPGAFDGAASLMCVELLTPDGNWSSYPPHKHDGSEGCTVQNEEIYYFRVGRTGTTAYDAHGFALHRTYTSDGILDENVTVRDGDVFLIPRGFHGPCTAAPGYPLYYLNVLAGPDDRRSMDFCDDPAHTWVRDSWAGAPVDPRCPMTSAAGPLR
ncbi:MAG: 5-deoxy-glucuronate isomerase [Iamia sp.]